MQKIFIVLAVVGTVLTNPLPTDVDNSIVVYEVHNEQAKEPTLKDVICAGALLAQRFIITNRECLALIKSDFSNLKGLKFVNQKEMLSKDIIKKIHLPETPSQNIGLIEIQKLEKAPDVLLEGTRPFDKWNAKDLFVYQFENVKPAEGGKLENVKMSRVKLDDGNLLPEKKKGDIIGLQHLPFNPKTEFKVWGAPLVGENSVVGVYTGWRTWRGIEHDFTDVDTHKNWVLERTKKNSQVRLQ